MSKEKLLSLWHRVRYKKHALLVALAVVLAGCAVFATVAWLTQSDKTVNAFTVGNVSAAVNETFDVPYTTKENVCVENTGDVPVYVRAYVSIYLQKADGTILSRVPVQKTDYTITWGDEQNWNKQGEFYYYLKPVQPNTKTTDLIKKVTDTTTQNGAFLVVDISTQAIQAEPTRAVEEAWQVTVDNDGNLAPSGNANP